MNTLTRCRRVVIPHDRVRAGYPEKCAWCGLGLASGQVATAGMNLGETAAVCVTCLTPPVAGVTVLEMTDEPWED